MKVLRTRCEFAEEIKRSRFIAKAAPLSSEAQLPELLELLSEPEANHNCWAWRVGERYRFDDAGEPGGSAGRPILQAIDGHEVDRVLVVVIRYFGGTKLGVGGLMRAYGGTAAKCLDRAQTSELQPVTALRLKLPFDAASAAYTIMQRHHASKSDESYQADGVELAIRIAASNCEAFKGELSDATRGQVLWLNESTRMEPDNE